MENKQETETTKESTSNGATKQETKDEKRKDEKKENEGKTSLFIRNVSRRVRSEDLWKLFEKYGELKDVYIPRDYETGEPRGFAYVQFKNHEDAKEALQKMNGYVLENREITVMFAEGERKTPSQMREKLSFILKNNNSFL